jgi:hypothetical protein
VPVVTVVTAAVVVNATLLITVEDFGAEVVDAAGRVVVAAVETTVVTTTGLVCGFVVDAAG